MEDNNILQDGGFLPEKGHSNYKEAKEDDPILLPMSLNKRCRNCSQVPIDEEIEETFKVLVCRNCRYKTLKFTTKTACLTNYLLSNEELKTFKFLVRPNPHKGTWSDMNLYLEDQIKSFAVNKWGSIDEIERVKEKRSKDLENRKIKKLKNKVKDLKIRTRIKSRSNEKHIHKFVAFESIFKCECGMIVDQEEF